jgi:hypothetical protein
MTLPVQPNLLSNPQRLQRSVPASLLTSIEKLARAGEQAGLSVPDMVEMLHAGLSVGELLDVIGYCLQDKTSRRA